jgi:hypothetical protein
VKFPYISGNWHDLDGADCFFGLQRAFKPMPRHYGTRFRNPAMSLYKMQSEAMQTGGLPEVSSHQTAAVLHAMLDFIGA